MFGKLLYGYSRREEIMIHLSVVVPIYRSEQSIEELYKRLCNTVNKITSEYEIIFVEDCGGDSTWDKINTISKKDSKVRGYQFTRNYGQHAATICGIMQSSGDWIVTIDDDLEQKPEDIIKLYGKINEGHDLVYGIYEKRKHSLWRNVTSNTVRKLFNFCIPKMNYDYTSFRIMKKDIGKSLALFDSPFPFVDGYLSWITNKYSTVTVEHSNRQYGESNYNIAKLVKHTLNIIVTFSELPLKAATWLGLSTFGLGSIWFIIIIIQKIFNGISISGYSSIMACILFFGGIQMLVLGIFGEYLGRISFKTSKKPLYIISKLSYKES